MLKFFIFLLNFVKFQTFQISCNFELDPEIGYMCIVPSITRQSKFDFSISSTSGHHHTKKSNENVNFFLSTAFIDFFPKNIEKNFKNIFGVGIIGGNLTKISKKDLKPFGHNLRILWLTNNAIEFISSDLFEFNKNLVEISLGFNKIKRVDGGAFAGLDSLSSLYFLANVCYSGEKVDNGEEIEMLVGEIEKKC